MYDFPCGSLKNIGSMFDYTRGLKEMRFSLSPDPNNSQARRPMPPRRMQASLFAKACPCVRASARRRVPLFSRRYWSLPRATMRWGM